MVLFATIFTPQGDGNKMLLPMARLTNQITKRWQKSIIGILGILSWPQKTLYWNTIVSLMAMQNSQKLMVITMDKKSRRIVYLADSDHRCEDRILSHTSSLTDILSETISYSNRELPKVGSWWIELVRVPVDGKAEGWTHSRDSSWVIDSVEVYRPINNNKHSEIVYCYCKYIPISNPYLVAIIDGDAARSKELVLA